MSDDHQGFVPLGSLRGDKTDPAGALGEIRKIYFATTKQTIQHDFVHAIELLKSLATEEEREKASVYMEGLAELRKEWAPPKKGMKKAR
jgi:anion-transporting  ArsA/GET3 family ATPase